MSGDNNIEQPEKFRFRIVHLMYVVAMLSSSMALFGAWGALVGGIICLLWLVILFEESFPRSSPLAEYLCIFSIIGILIGLFLPSVRMATSPSRVREYCISNMKDIGIAMHAYHDEFGSFPPAYITDEEGKPKHSWRVLLLPYLGEDALYDQYDFDEPWNGPNNRQLLFQIPPAYRCPKNNLTSKNNGYNCTNYLAVSGENTAWPGKQSRSISELTAGITNSLQLAEVNELNVPWTQPIDLSEEQALSLFTKKDTDPKLLPHPGGRHVLLADGSFEFAFNNKSKKSWSSWFQIDRPYFVEEQPEIPKKQNRYAVAFQVYLFVTLLLLPMPWVKGKYKE